MRAAGSWNALFAGVAALMAVAFVIFLQLTASSLHRSYWYA